MKIRKAIPQDKTNVIRLFEELRNYTSKREITLTQEQTEKVSEYFEKVLTRNDIYLLVAEDDGALIGMLTMYVVPSIKHGSERAIIEDVLVTQDLRNKGIGSKLFDEAKKIALENNINCIKLNSDRDYIEAHSFYTKNGGKQTELMFRFDL